MRTPSERRSRDGRLTATDSRNELSKDIRRSTENERSSDEGDVRYVSIGKVDYVCPSTIQKSPRQTGHYLTESHEQAIEP